MNKATKVFLNGNVYTVNKNRDWAQSVAICDDKIIYVGDNEGAKALIGKNTEVIDITGKMLLPGFTDAHCHPVIGTFFAMGLSIDVEWDLDRVLSEIKKFVGNNPDRRSYFGIGFAEWNITEEIRRKEVLDKVCPDKPIIVLGSSGHEGWCNSKALEIAGITKDTPDPIPGLQFYGRDPDGSPNGRVVDTAPCNTIVGAIKPFDFNKVKEGLVKIFQRFSEMGITGLGEAAAWDYMEDLAYPMIKEMEDKGELLQRISGSTFCIAECPLSVALPKLIEFNKKYHSDMFKFHTLKILNDGTAEANSASLTVPIGDGEIILPVFSGEEFAGIGKAAAKNGFDINVHAIGDLAIRETLNMAKAVREAGYNDCRITNAHTQMTQPEDAPLFVKYDVTVNTTTLWIVANEKGELGYVPKELEPLQYNIQSILKYGARLNLGSDFPIDLYGLEPLRAIEMGKTRRVYGRPNTVPLSSMDESLSLEQTIEAYTINGAYHMRLEDKCGSIEKGKYADIVILDQNIFDVDTYSIHDIPIFMTLMNGKVTYQNNKS